MAEVFLAIGNEELLELSEKKHELEDVNTFGSATRTHFFVLLPRGSSSTKTFGGKSSLG